MTKPEVPVLSAKEAARKLGTCLDRVYSLIWAEKLPAKKVEGRWFVPLAAVEERLRKRGA